MLTLLPIFVILFNFGCCDHSFDYQIADNEGHTIIDNEDKHLEYHTYSSADVTFYLYTPTNNKTVKITPENTYLLNMSKPTKIIIHGLGSYQDQIWIDQLVRNYHTKGDYNVIAVDWSKISTRDTFYAVEAVNEVGEVIAQFIMEIRGHNEEFLTDVHLIGSSLGAQVGAVAGEKIANKTNKKIDRITGLDPSDGDLKALDKDDAEFVDVIHSSLLLGEEKYGTVDFYVTGDNPSKRNCFNDSCGFVAHGLYAQTILDENRFEGVSCQNATAYIRKLCKNNTKVVMGESVPRNASGSFYLTTDSAPGRHRLVNDVLKHELQNGVHALSIVAKTPEQWKHSVKTVESSPNCRGGFGK
ncbi:pancreatic triacylglycerol lipase-like [Asbolus verrucosus]|uniref:Pancreatic triacylglycerol lipase-like n=1 Tax=Asbolus verrucosus TaxID=1661398 RepID=A0A482VZ17_ASBVE|nr:pancreatic triacylglycerol lipase-like [Asbolus verrucosus]